MLKLIHQKPLSICFRTILWVLLITGPSWVYAEKKPTHYGVGQKLTPYEIKGWDIDVRPDGQGLPAGKGSAIQGRDIYDKQCASCHGVFGESHSYMALAGGAKSLKAEPDGVRTLGNKLAYPTTVFDYIRRAMPMNAPQSLSADELYAVTAYVLHLNDIVAEDVVLDATTLPQVIMPNQKGMTLKHGMMKTHAKPDVQAVACMRNCRNQVHITSTIPQHAQSLMDLAMNQGRQKTQKSQQPLSPLEWAKNKGCLVCHGVDQAVVGPAFLNIAAKYKNQTGAQALLMNKITSGGSGNWGNIPMPPQTGLDQQQLERLVSWIVSLPEGK